MENNEKDLEGLGIEDDEKELDEMGIEEEDVESIVEGRVETIGLEELLLQREEPEPSQPAETSNGPGSGLINLANMVARASVEQARRPSVAPLAHVGGRGTGTGNVRLEIATSDIPPAFQPIPRKKYLVPVFVVMTLVFVVAVGAILMLQRRRAAAAREVEKAKFALLQTELEKAISAKQVEQAEPAEPAAAVVDTAKAPETEEAPKEPDLTASEKKAVEEEASDEEPQIDEDEDSEPETMAVKAGKKSSKKSSRHKKKRRSRRSAEREVAKEEPAKDPGDDLDSLIGTRPSSSASSRDTSEKQSSSKRPSRSEIMSAMGPVASQASSCARFAKGTVQIRITVASDGRVQSARSLGGFAGTNTGQCVEAAAKTARFPSFDGSPFTFTYPITIR